MIDDTDLPVDGNPCTEDHCTNGVAWWWSLPAGAPCGQGLVCDGADACVGCLVDTDCPATGGECAAPVCSAGTCTFAPVAEGAIVLQQTPGDCHQNRCDGQGHVVAVVDDADLPSDGTVCTLDVCSGGVPSNPPASIGTPCAENGGVVCDGNGTCVPGCLNGSDCPSGICIDWKCAESTCRTLGQPCSSSSDCCWGYFCGANGCVASPFPP